MYTWVVNTKYSPVVINPTSQAVKDSATWNWAFFKSVFTTDDDIKIIYNNPLHIGVDTYTFTVPKGMVNVSIENKNVIKEFSLSQNYPNPFNPSTTIQYEIPKNGSVTIKVYDVLGREVKTLVNEQKSLGNYRVEFNGSKFASGVYFYQLRVGSYLSTKKMILLK